jgi:hypothetical protein
MIQLKTPPVGEDGAPTWNDEVQSATQWFGQEFLAPFMFETSPRKYLGGFVPKAILKTPVRTYEARAILIHRTNDELRTTAVVTAPGVPREEIGNYPWIPYSFQYNTSLPKVHVRDIVNTIRQHCEKSHAEELQTRKKIRDDMGREEPSPMRAARDFE